MDKISTYAFGVTLETLRDSFKRGNVPEGLYDPLQSLLQKVTRKTAEKSISIYLFSDDANAELRNLFGFILAKSLIKHVPSALLVDCEFLDVGMNGIVPQKDALGFLDLLLYGSSLGVITQETSGGVHVIGAGSFPVTKKMPFVMNAFDEASRRLLAHGRCVIFSGPLHEDEGEIHSLVGAVDVPVLVRAADFLGPGMVDPIEEQIASRWNKEVLSVRISTSGEPVPAPSGIDGVAAEKVDEGDEEVPPQPAGQAEEAGIKPVIAHPTREPGFEEIKAPVAGGPGAKTGPEDGLEYGEEALKLPYKEKRYTSLFPRIATWVIGIIIVLFVVWWFQQERSRDDTGTALQQEETTPVAESGQTQTDEQIAAAEEQPAETGEVTAEPDAQQPAQVEVPPETTAAPGEEAPSGTTAAQPGVIDSQDIHVMDDLNSSWSGYYIIHISSFRGSAKARDEVAYLEEKDFPAFIVYLDLGAKGTWYRVYVGPFETRDEARIIKKELDDTPRVRFTRITRISGR